MVGRIPSSRLSRGYFLFFGFFGFFLTDLLFEYLTFFPATIGIGFGSFLGLFVYRITDVQRDDVHILHDLADELVISLRWCCSRYDCSD